MKSVRRSKSGQSERLTAILKNHLNSVSYEQSSGRKNFGTVHAMAFRRGNI